VIFIAGCHREEITLPKAVLRPVLTSKFSASHPSPKHSLVTHAGWEGFRLPAAPPHDP